MAAILANSIENSGRLSDSLQLYWNSHVVYRIVSLFETKKKFMNVMTRYQCGCVIWEGTGGFALLIGQDLYHKAMLFCSGTEIIKPEDKKSMTLEWYFMLLGDPQGFWKLPNHYLTAPFIDNGREAAVFPEFWDTVLNHPLGLLVIVLLLLGVHCLQAALPVILAVRKKNSKNGNSGGIRNAVKR